MEPETKLHSYLTKHISKKNWPEETKKLFHVDKGNNPSRRYNKCMHICSEFWCTKFHETNTTDIKVQREPNTIIEFEFNTPVSPIHSSSTHNQQRNFKIK
jgi:hypothetical protein